MARKTRQLCRLVLGGALTGALLVATACSGEATMSADSAGGNAIVEHEDGGGAPDADTPDEAAPMPGRDGGGSAGGPVNRPSVQTRAVIRKGSISVVTDEMNRARSQIDDLLGRHGGYLASEDTTNDAKGRPERSVLVLRVPEPSFGDVMGELGDIGRTVRADRSSEDVTTEVIDVDTRVATAEASLARLQRFMRRTADVEDMIRVESEIATRQAELESLKARQKYLSDQTALSTITVRLRTPYAPPPEPPSEDSGFLAGLSDGWSALKTVLVGAATVTGAVLPFALALLLLGVPLWLVARATLTRRRSPATAPPQPE